MTAYISELKDYCSGKKLTSGQLDALKGKGFLSPEGFLTDAGIAQAESEGVIMRELSVITLKSPIIAPTVGDGVKRVIQKGSQLLVLFGGRNKKTGVRWYEVSAGKAFPILTIHGNHDIVTHKWPVGLDVEAIYK